MGTPDVSDLTLSSGAGHGEAGDAPQQGPAQERIEPLPAQPKPANPETAASEVEAKSKISKPKEAEIIVVNFETAGPLSVGLVTAHPKPAKRMNAKERAKARFKDKSSAEDRTKPTMTEKAKSKAKSKKSKAAVPAA